MNKTIVKINPGKQSHVLNVELINTLGRTVAIYEFYNFIENGDSLARLCSDWVNSGLFPMGNSKGLVEITRF